MKKVKKEEKKEKVEKHYEASASREKKKEKQNNTKSSFCVCVCVMWFAREADENVTRLNSLTYARLLILNGPRPPRNGEMFKR